MSFVSYAQNFEDVMLWRALKHVENGFYIDVGANDPTIDSVTKAFYDRGWNGINIEPIASHFYDLNRERPRDINLQCAAGESTGEINIWECDVRGWATASRTVREQYEAEGYKGVTYKVSVTTLAEICTNHVRGEIHLLKIDVEGFERSVIAGMNFYRFRPWIVVVEANKPNSVEESYENWEELVISKKYSIVYTDGLNRFYVSDEHKELIPSLKYPPNVFDEFIRSEQLNSELRAQKAKAKAQEAETRAKQSEAAVQTAEAKTREAETRAKQSEAAVQTAEAKTREAEARAKQSEAAVQTAEAKTREAETRAKQSEAAVQTAEAKTREAEARAKQSEAAVQTAEAKTREAETRAKQSEAALTAIYNSRSWRFTGPLRWTGDAARWFVRGSVAWLTFAPNSRPRRILRAVIITMKSEISGRPTLKNMAKRLLSFFPKTEVKLRSIGNPYPTRIQLMPNPIDDIDKVKNLSPRARQIYFDLKAAIEQHQREQS